MKTIVLYPGRFQPMLPHHAEVYRHLQAQFPDADVYITTSNKVEPGKSPFDASEKIEIMTGVHGIPRDKIIISKNMYNWKEYEKTFVPNSEHKLIFAVGGKDMEGNPRFSFKPKKDGTAGYLQMINTNNDTLSMEKRGYVYQAPTVGNEDEAASASAFRQALITAPDLDSAKQVFTGTMGKFDQRIFDLVYDKITGKIMKESLETLKKLAGLLDEAPVNFSPGKGSMDYEPGISTKDQKSAAQRPEKAAASNPNSVGFTKIAPNDMISVDTGRPVNSKQRARSMANQFPDGADINDPSVKKDQFLKLLARSPGFVLGEINARLANDDEGFAVSDRLSNIIDTLPEGGVMALSDEDRKWTLALVNNAINNMELHKKDAELDNFDEPEAEPGTDVDDEPEMVSLDDPEYDSQQDDELEMEEMKKLAGLKTESDQPKNCGCGKNPCETYGNPEEAIEEAGEVPTHSDLEQAYNRIYQMTDEMGDEALEQMNHYAPKFSDALERADGNIDDIPAQEIPTYMAELDNAAFEMGAPEFVPFEAVEQEQEVEEADELNDIRRRAGLEVKEGDGTENDCKHCGGLGTHKDEDGEKYDCERCQGTGQIGNDEQDEPTNDGTPAYKKYINSTNTEGLDLSSVVDSIVETDSEVNVMDMEDEELHAYVGQKEEDLVQDMIHHFAPDYVGKDNFEERYMQYREEVLEPAAQDVSADKNADDMAGTDYDSEDFVDNHNMVGDDEVNQEESIDEFKQSEFDLDEPDGYYSLISNTGKDVQVGQQIDKLQKPNKLVTVVPPSGGIPALAIIMNARGQQIKVTQDSLSQIGYKIVARKDPTAPSNADQSPRQPDLPGLDSVQPEVVETAIDNALEETMSELRKLAGL